MLIPAALPVVFGDLPSDGEARGERLLLLAGVLVSRDSRDPRAFPGRADDDARLLACYQLASGVAATHARGVAFGGRGMRTEDVVVDGAPEVHSRVSPGYFAPPPEDEDEDAKAEAKDKTAAKTETEESPHPPGSSRFGALPIRTRVPGRLPTRSLTRTRRRWSATAAWRAGAVSNLDYILELNRRAGRSRGDRGFHALFLG